MTYEMHKRQLSAYGAKHNLRNLEGRLLCGLDPAGMLAGEGFHDGPEAWCKALDRARIEPGSRSFRLRVADVECTVEDDAVTVSFALHRGAYATSVIREVCTT